MSFGSASGLSSSFGTLDVNTLVTKLMQVERNPAALMQNRKQQIKNKGDAIKSVATDVKALRTAAEALSLASKWQPLKATSSSTAVTTSATTGTVTASLTFRVDRLATSEKLYSTTTVAATTAKVADPGHLAVAGGLGTMGLGTITGGTALTLGSHTLAVTGAGAAVKTADQKLAAAELTGADHTLDIKLNGATFTLDLATGTYAGPQELLDAVNLAIKNAGHDTDLKASLTDGKLALTTTATGSAASLQVLGSSTALTKLGLIADTAAVTGAAKITLDGQVNDIADTDNHAGATLSLLGKGGATNVLTVNLTAPLVTGSSTVKNVDLGDGSLGAVTAAINNAGGTVSAAAVQVSPGQYRLQLESTTAGAQSGLNIDFAGFVGGRAAYSSVGGATDASITVLSGGVAAYSVTSTSNTFTDVLPGVTFTVASVPTDPVTISASRDVDAVSAKVADLVSALNKVVAGVAVKTTYNAGTRVAGPLLGNLTASRAVRDLSAAFTDPVTGSSVSLPTSVGITVKKDGTLDFDKDKFAKAYQADPAGVQRMFQAPLGATDVGIVQRLQKAADSATNFTTGYLTTSGTQFDNSVTSMDKQLEAFEVRMQMRETALRRQYNSLNTVLEQMNGQNSALASAIAGLPSGGM
jgi:flagellar hook-associated protein 2